MKTLSLAEAKAKLGRLIRDIEGRGEEFLITRNGRPAALLISLDEYESWKETIAILSDRQLMHEIDAGLAALRARQARPYTLKELFRTR